MCLCTVMLPCGFLTGNTPLHIAVMLGHKGTCTVSKFVQDHNVMYMYMCIYIHVQYMHVPVGALYMYMYMYMYMCIEIVCVSH